MELSDLPNSVPSFSSMTHSERVKVLGWFLHVYVGKEFFNTTDVRKCYETLHLSTPNLADVLSKLAQKRPVVLIKKGNSYKLEMSVRQAFNSKFGNRPITIAIEKSLLELPGRLSDETKSKYLTEAINCLKANCFRAGILMAWNLAYDHLLSWILAEPTRLSKFNSNLPAKPPFTKGLIVARREDFEWLGEREVVDICGHKNVAVITDNLKKILQQSLDWRNMSAHPATIEIKQVTAEHTVYNLVENVVLRLA